ncbi:aminoglycoside phosphotransferase family protein [Paenibacillus sp. JCM 10914]|uniref:phosphotransferase n=1 Tax=Paenibacillus sp. JCM 10914 TaxID=1236974 RepID=UPI0003CC9C99|nr:phosphotransferase [Paenibacillus sp. JCM 10914]GAE05493.1 aminoglycoside phosphotransferase [Paenibacillus sp. JCM 10914]
MAKQQWDADWTINDKLVEHLISTQFPRLTSLPVCLIGSGWDNMVYQVGDDYVFRFPRRKAAIPLLEKESLILPKLDAFITLPYAKPLFFGNETADYPSPFLGYTYLSGTFPIGLSDEVRVRSTGKLAHFLKTLHTYPTNTAAQAGLLHDQRNLLDLTRRKERMYGFLTSLGSCLSAADRLEIESFLEEITLDRVNPKHVLLHGDLHFKNILVDHDGIIYGVIDWGDVQIGHPACDLSIAYSFLPPAARQQFFDTYGTVDAQTHLLARMMAVYIPMLIGLQAKDTGDEHTLNETLSIIRRALANE